MSVMLSRGVRLLLKHRSVVTGVLLGALLVNLMVVARLQPAAAFDSDLPIAARCQGGGPGCAEQPLIPPPAGGLPHFDAPPAPVFGQLVVVEPAQPASIHESVPIPLDRPPSTPAAV